MKKTFVLIAVFATLFCYGAAAQMTMVWKNDTAFQGPESVVYDRQNNCLYVSNYNRNPKDGDAYNSDCVSKVDLKGNVLDKYFVRNLTCPTGLFIHQGKLYIVERFGIVRFDIAANQVERRYRINGPGFLNDIAVDDGGDIFVTVSDKEMIYRIRDGAVEKWLESNELAGINGIIVDGHKLVVGITGDSCLKSVSLDDKEIGIIARFPSGILDGVKKTGNDYLVSHFEGNLYRVGEDGKVNEILNVREPKLHCADFEYIEEKNLFVIPALWNNSVVAYKYFP